VPATTNPKETVQVKSTTPQELARKEVNRKKVEEYLDAQDAELGTNFKFVYQADLANEEKVAELMRSEGYRKFEDAQNKKRYWTEVKRLMQLDREHRKVSRTWRGPYQTSRPTTPGRLEAGEAGREDDRPRRTCRRWSSGKGGIARRRRNISTSRSSERRRRFLPSRRRSRHTWSHQARRAPRGQQQEARSAVFAGRDLEGDDAVTRGITA
jgi:hypothetical protein